MFKILIFFICTTADSAGNFKKLRNFESYSFSFGCLVPINAMYQVICQFWKRLLDNRKYDGTYMVQWLDKRNNPFIICLTRKECWVLSSIRRNRHYDATNMVQWLWTNQIILSSSDIPFVEENAEFWVLLDAITDTMMVHWYKHGTVTGMDKPKNPFIICFVCRKECWVLWEWGELVESEK